MDCECVVVTPANFKDYLKYCCRAKSYFDLWVINCIFLYYKSLSDLI